LLTICNPKTKLCIKQENKPRFDKEDETIKLNLEYKSANILVRIIPQGAAKKIDGAEDKANANIENSISKERGAMIDGAVVKIMKTNKDQAVDHSYLIEKTCQMITLFKA